MTQQIACRMLPFPAEEYVPWGQILQPALPTARMKPLVSLYPAAHLVYAAESPTKPMPAIAEHVFHALQLPIDVYSAAAHIFTVQELLGDKGVQYVYARMNTDFLYG